MSRQAVAATPQAVATSAVLKRTFQDEVYGSIIRLSYGERLDKVLAQKRIPMVARHTPHLSCNPITDLRQLWIGVHNKSFRVPCSLSKNVWSSYLRPAKLFDRESCPKARRPLSSFSLHWRANYTRMNGNETAYEQHSVD
jgi:hypothetical protein